MVQLNLKLTHKKKNNTESNKSLIQTNQTNISNKRDLIWVRPETGNQDNKGNK